MWDRENPYELQFLPGESCFKIEEEPQKDEVAQLQQAIVAAQQRLKELRTKEERNASTIKQLKGDLQKKSAALVPNNGYSVDFAILIDSEDNLQWFKKRSQTLVSHFTAVKLEVPQHLLRVGVVFYNAQRATSGGDCKVLPFTEDFHQLTEELPPVPKDASFVIRGSLKGAIGEALNLLQWQGTARILLHPSPSSSIQKGHDPPAPTNSHFFRFSNTGNSSSSNNNHTTAVLSGESPANNVELQRAILAMRAMYIDYFIMKTGPKKPTSQKKERKFTVAVAQYFDDPESCLECRFLKIEEAQNIKKTIISCIGMALRT